MITDLFHVGARWRHTNLGFLVHITDEVETGQYLIAFAPEPRVAALGSPNSPPPPFQAGDSMSSYILKGTWTAEMLIREFEPLELLASDRWDRILENFDDPDDLD